MRKPVAFIITLALGVAILVPGSDARAEPTVITACQTISQPGSYRLANNLTTIGDCLVITANFVTIDLAGFSISGGGTSGTGLLAAPPSGELEGIAVRNGSIFRFVAAVDLSAAAGSIVEGLRVSEGPFNGINANGIVKGNIVSGRGAGVGIIAGPGSTVTGNDVRGNRGGINAGAGSTVTGNTATNNARAEIFVEQGSTVIGNTATSTGGLAGIQVACPSNVIDNTAVGHTFNLQLGGEGCHSEDNVAP